MRRRPKMPITLGAAFLTAILLLAACQQDQPAPGQDPALLQGQKVFGANCAACHGQGGEGQPNWHVRKTDGTLPPPPLNGEGHTWHHGDGTLYTYVSEGGAAYESPSYKSGMPAFGDNLSHEQIVAVINYLKSLWGDRVAEGLGIVKKESQASASENDPFPSSPP